MKSAQRCSVCRREGPTCKEHLVQMKVAQKLKRQLRKAHGQCYDCGRKAQQGYVYCGIHRRKRLIFDRGYRSRKRKRQVA